MFRDPGRHIVSEQFHENLSFVTLPGFGLHANERVSGVQGDAISDAES